MSTLVISRGPLAYLDDAVDRTLYDESRRWPSPILLSSVYRLAYRVLRLALADLSSPSSRLREDALVWLTRTDTSWPFSASSLCDLFDLPLDEIRRCCLTPHTPCAKVPMYDRDDRGPKGPTLGQQQP